MQVMQRFDAGPTTDLPRPVGDQLDFAQPITSEFHANPIIDTISSVLFLFSRTCQFNQLQVSTKGQNSEHQAITKVIVRLHASIQQVRAS
jgi:hypothetical protein